MSIRIWPTISALQSFGPLWKVKQLVELTSNPFSVSYTDPTKLSTMKPTTDPCHRSYQRPLPWSFCGVLWGFYGGSVVLKGSSYIECLPWDKYARDAAMQQHGCCIVGTHWGIVWTLIPWQHFSQLFSTFLIILVPSLCHLKWICILVSWPLTPGLTTADWEVHAQMMPLHGPLQFK